jgi:hypothetical protein
LYEVNVVVVVVVVVVAAEGRKGLLGYGAGGGLDN